MTYQSPRINNCLDKSISVVLPNAIWSALEKMARQQNTSKAELARREIVNLVNRVSHNQDAPNDRHS